MKRILAFIVATVLLLLGMLSVVKGDIDSLRNNATYMSNQVGSPFESTHTTSRYSLITALVQDKSIFLSPRLAAFSSPDLTKIGDKYISIFTPGVALLSTPAYMIGNMFGYPQLFTFFFISLVSIANIFLVQHLSIKLGSSSTAGLVSGLIFAFATNSLVYSSTLTQHNLSVLLILSTIILAFKEVSYKNTLFFGFISGLAIIVDIPNVFLIAPQTLYLIFKHLNILKIKEKTIFSIKLSIFGLIIGLLPSLAIFGSYNYLATGHPLKLGQRLGRAIYPPEVPIESQKIIPTDSHNKEKFKQFDTERQIDGYDILLFSKTRGLLRYSPVLIFAFLGLFAVYKSKNSSNILQIVIGGILINIILYAMFNDPWGGWAFGPRYLIPASALLCSALGYSITLYGKKLLFALIFLPSLWYSIYLNFAGAITTSVVPPSVYTQNLVDKIHDNYKYNFGLIEKNKSSSLIYNAFLSKYLTLKNYLYLLSLSGATIITIIYLKPLKVNHE